MVNPPREGMKAARLLMVLSSVSPLFILWAVRGNKLVPDAWFIGACATMVVGPNAFLWLRIATVRKQADQRTIIVGTADDHRDHILVYLFAMLLPFYSETLDTFRELAATVGALAFIVFLFWHMNLHYMNLVFAAGGYRVFTVSAPNAVNHMTSRTRQALITRRVSLTPGDSIVAYRLSNTVYMEMDA